MARARAREMEMEAEVEEFPHVFRKRTKPLDASPIQSQQDSQQPFKWGTRKKKSRKELAAPAMTGFLKVPKDMQSRWSTERYSGAQECLIQILHAKGAVPGAPVQRQDLRTEARKYIGDTGLLDHLLKHMADKVIATGERFRRRHNFQGGMEYWLEDAGFMELRKAANITDQFWTPPPGWTPGESLPPTDAEVIRSLREEVEQLKSELRLQLMSREEPVLAITDVPEAEYMLECAPEPETMSMNEERPEEDITRLDNVENPVMERLERLENELGRRLQEDKARQEMQTLEKLTLEAQFANLWKAVMTMQEKLSGIEASLQVQNDQSRHQLRRGGLVPCSNDEQRPFPHAFKPCRPLGTFLMPGMTSSNCAPFRVEDILSPRSNSSDSSDVTTVSKTDETEQLFLTAAVQAFQDGLNTHHDSSWLGLRPSPAPLQA